MLYRETYSEINLDAIKHNLHVLEKHTGKKVFSVCKANAYSHSDIHIANTAHENGSPYICVSSFDEAMALRQQDFKGDILILGYVDPTCVKDLIDYAITVSVFSNEWVQSIQSLSLDLSKLKIHIKVETGMNRIGFKDILEIQEAIHIMSEKHIEIEGIYTHFHSADSEDKQSCDAQVRTFYTILDNLNCRFKWIHTSNSDAALSYKDERSNAVRVGLALYGIKSISNSIELQPVLSLYSTIVHIKQVKAHETVGYGATYMCSEDSIIATLPIGYGDGLIRKNQGRKVYVDECPVEIVGRVCMDQTMIKVDKFYPIGTRIEIIGKHTSIEKMAEELDMIPYEVLCLLNERITKVIIEDGKIIEVVNNRLKIH